uniref:SNF2 N-terminal domain-containing protein n=1 Tax=Brassica campestris TaxID=3711 RepID=M4F2Y6_BRACM
MSLPLHTTKINFHPDCREFGITVTLKPHQVEGVSSLIYKYLLSVNVLLVVLCPLSVTDGWVEETKGSLQNMKFLGMLVIKIAIGIFESLLLFNVLFTTYAIALMDQDFLSQIRWQYAVIDEAQILKNPNSVVSLGIFIEF